MCIFLHSLFISNTHLSILTTLLQFHSLMPFHTPAIHSLTCPANSTCSLLPITSIPTPILLELYKLHSGTNFIPAAPFSQYFPLYWHLNALSPDLHFRIFNFHLLLFTEHFQFTFPRRHRVFPLHFHHCSRFYSTPEHSHTLKAAFHSAGCIPRTVFAMKKPFTLSA